MTFVVFLSVLILGIVLGLPIAWALIACGIEMIDELERQIDPHFLDIRYVPLTRGEAKSAAGIVT